MVWTALTEKNVVIESCLLQERCMGIAVKCLLDQALFEVHVGEHSGGGSGVPPQAFSF